MKRSLLLAGAVAVLATVSVPLIGRSQTPPPPAAAVPPAVAAGPSALPDRIILTWQGDPARSQAVTWRTDTSVTQPVAEVAVASDGPEFIRRRVQVRAVTAPLASDLGSALYHTASFEELKPATRYAYRVGDGANWSEWFQFWTASDRPEPFSFVYFGDAQNDVKSLWSRVIREAYTEAPKARFIIHAGDLINRANRDAEWGEWFAAGGWVNGMVPSVPAPGNHEYDRVDGGPRVLSRHWRPQFALPEHGPKGLEETAYYLDYQGVRIVALNSNERHAEQAQWLDGVLKENPNRWTVLTFHHPVASTARGRDNAAMRAAWKPVLDRHRVDLVLQGHDHTYARGNLATGLNVRDGGVGTMYVVSVSGPKAYQVDRVPWMQRVAENTQLFQVISIDGDRLAYQARTATGHLYDAFDLVKQPGQPNRLVDRTPKDVPERLGSRMEAAHHHGPGAHVH